MEVEMPSVNLQNPNIDVEWFKRKLEEKHLTIRGLAKRMELNPSTVSLMLRGIRSIHNEDAVKLADAFSVTPIEIFKRAGAPIEDEVRKIKVLMYVDENSRMVTVPDEVADEFKAPYDSPTNAFAVQIRTGRRYDGWIMVVSGNKVNPDDCINTLSVYCTEKGDVNMGMIRRGYISGTYNVSNDMHNGEDANKHQNLKIVWCQPVIWIKPSSL
jgi:transcriptional regulator with XRE-family HTH domain